MVKYRGRNPKEVIRFYEEKLRQLNLAYIRSQEQVKQLESELGQQKRRSQQLETILFGNKRRKNKPVFELLTQDSKLNENVISYFKDCLYIARYNISRNRWGVLYNSSNLEQLTGYPLRKFVDNWSFWLNQLVHSEDRPKVRHHIETLQTEESCITEYRIWRANGELVWVRDSSQVHQIRKNRGVDKTRLIYGILSDITKPKQNIEALRLYHEQRELHLKNLPLGFVEWDTDLHISRWSEQAAEIFGWSAAEMQGLYWRDLPFLRDEDIPRVTTEVSQVLFSGEGEQPMVVSNLTKAGQLIYCEWYNTAQFNEKGEVISAFSLVRDITRRKTMELALRQSEQILRRIHLVTTDRSLSLEQKIDTLLQIGCQYLEFEFGLFNHLQEGRLHMKNFFKTSDLLEIATSYPVAETLCGMVADMPSSNWPVALFQITADEPDIYPLCPKGIKSYLGMGVVVEGKVYGVLSFAATKFHSNPLLGVEEKIVRLMGHWIGMEIERKQQAEALRQREEQMRLVIQNMPLMMNAVDEQCRLVAWNRQCEKITGYEAAEIIGTKTIGNMFQPSTLVSKISPLAGVQQAYPTWQWEFINKEGETRIVIWSNISAQYPIAGWAAWGVGIEITDQLENHRKLEAQKAELLRSNAALQEFASVASHDLQAPLRKIRMFSERLQIGFAHQLDGRGLKFLERLISAATHGQELIENLLVYSRVTSKAQPFVETDLNEVVEKTLQLLEADIEVAQGQVLLESPLPTIYADPSQMQQLFQNLISNGLKFSPPDTPPQLKINVSEQDDQIVISVKDNGIGFDEQYLTQIFKPFQRLTHGANYPGTGIGLAICKKIVERHGGSITASSEPNHGTTFFVTLPRFTTNTG